MTTHPHVLALLRYEEQRIGVPIHLSALDDGPSTMVALRVPPSDAWLETHPISGPDGTTSQISLARLPDGDALTLPGIDGPLRIAVRDAHIVKLAFDPSQMVDAVSKPLLSLVWDAAVAPALTAAAEHVREHADRKQLEAFIRVEEQVWRQTLQRVPNEINDLEHGVTRLEGQMREHLVKLGDLRRQHRALQLALPEAVRLGAREQHEALRRLVPNVYRSAELRGSQVVATIGPIILEDEDGNDIEVGNFEVVLALDTAHVGIRNTSNIVHGFHHPHVRGPQDICWGNVRAGVMRLLAEREWAGLLTVIARFLNSYTDGDAYQKLSAWDPNRSDDDGDSDNDEAHDDDDSDDSTTECVLCLERFAEPDLTWVRDEPVCATCVERDCFQCARCHRQYTSREQARESAQCATCWQATAAATPDTSASTVTTVTTHSASDLQAAS